MPTRILLLLICSIAIAPQLLSHDEPNKALFFDKPIAKTMPIEFEAEEDLYPTRSTFNIVDFAFLSNEIGERWALVVVENTVHESRTFTSNQLIGFLASGEYRKPIKLNKRIEGMTRETFMIPFGRSDLPLVKLMTRGF